MRKILFACSMLLAMFAASAFAQDEDLRKGVDLYQEGKFSEAVEVLEKFILTDPNHWAAWTYLGGALANLGREQEAITALTNQTKGFRQFEIIFDKPLKITKKYFVGYTKKARMNGVEGTVTLSVEFRSDGKIGFVVPLKLLPDGLTENAVETARKMKFEPAERNGKPVSDIRKVTYSFSIGR